MTGRAGVAVVFAACFLGLLIADLVHWTELADAVFFLAATLTVYHVRPGGLLPVVVSPPLLFFAACPLSQAVARELVKGPPDSVIGVTVDTLAASAGWLVLGSVLTVGIALLRGLSGEVRTLLLGDRR